ncbi:MAG: Holliday junction branch migration protein RuvA [Mycoplasmoidaceae bacterium]
MEYILGQVKEKMKDSIILQNNNIGYRIYLNNFENYEINKEYKLFIFTKQTFLNSTIHSKFFGFETYKQKNLFEKIISINGIGPKNALNILKIDYQDLINNIRENNINFFIIDNKISKRITDLFLSNINIEKISDNNKLLNNQELSIRKDLNDYLKYLGFDKLEIKKIISELDFRDSIENLIKISIEKRNLLKEKNHE